MERSIPQSTAHRSRSQTFGLKDVCPTEIFFADVVKRRLSLRSYPPPLSHSGIFHPSCTHASPFPFKSTMSQSGITLIVPAFSHPSFSLLAESSVPFFRPCPTMTFSIYFPFPLHYGTVSGEIETRVSARLDRWNISFDIFFLGFVRVFLLVWILRQSRRHFFGGGSFRKNFMREAYVPTFGSLTGTGSKRFLWLTSETSSSQRDDDLSTYRTTFFFKSFRERRRWEKGREGGLEGIGALSCCVASSQSDSLEFQPLVVVRYHAHPRSRTGSKRTPVVSCLAASRFKDLPW